VCPRNIEAALLRNLAIGRKLGHKEALAGVRGLGKLRSTGVTMRARAFYEEGLQVANEMARTEYAITLGSISQS
jgi:hypothetical protein